MCYLKKYNLQKLAGRWVLAEECGPHWKKFPPLGVLVGRSLIVCLLVKPGGILRRHFTAVAHDSNPLTPLLLCARASLDLSLRHTQLEKKTGHDTLTRKQREKDRDLRQLKKLEQQLKVATDAQNHQQSVYDKVKDQVRRRCGGLALFEIIIRPQGFRTRDISCPHPQYFLPFFPGTFSL